MILSFHPCVVTDENRICAGRPPDHQDLAAIRRATAVILPQGCPESLFQMARDNCAYLFPQHQPRFAYPGKIGQARLFREHNLALPETRCFSNLATYHKEHPDPGHPPLPFPLVLKLNWGGEGDTVFPAADAAELGKALIQVQRHESSGQTGFLIQKHIPTRPGQGTLRVAVIGRMFFSYWRIPASKDAFHSSLAHGAGIDHAAWPEAQAKGVVAVKQLCDHTGINLAGLDLIFPGDTPDAEPYFLEINHFFGRKGLGGSERFYQYLNQAVAAWLKDNNLT